MKTINIKGKEYVPVVERVKEFHRICRGSITTEVVPSSETNRVMVRAKIYITAFLNQNGGFTLYETPYEFTGHSQAEYGKGMMGGVALEVAETSAVGRALGFANIGLLDGIASADEMRKVSKVEAGSGLSTGKANNEDLDF